MSWIFLFQTLTFLQAKLTHRRFVIHQQYFTSASVTIGAQLCYWSFLFLTSPADQLVGALVMPVAAMLWEITEASCVAKCLDLLKYGHRDMRMLEWKSISTHYTTLLCRFSRPGISLCHCAAGPLCSCAQSAQTVPSTPAHYHGAQVPWQMSAATVSCWCCIHCCTQP